MGCDQSQPISPAKQAALDRYNQSAPLSPDEISKRIVSSKATEKMTVKGPDNQFVIAYAYLSQRGYYPNALNKANQDAFSSDAEYNGEKGLGLWGVYDGHGGSGDLVSHFTKKALPKHLIMEMRKRGKVSGR